MAALFRVVEIEIDFELRISKCGLKSTRKWSEQKDMSFAGD